MECSSNLGSATLEKIGKENLMAFDTELMDSPKEFFKKGDVLKIEKKDWGGEFAPNLVVYLDDMLIGYVADDKDTPKECSKASDIEYLPGKTYAIYLGKCENKIIENEYFHVAKIMFGSESKVTDWVRSMELSEWISRYDLLAHDYHKLLMLLREGAHENQSAEEVLKKAKEKRLKGLH